MTTIRRINVSQLDGNGADDTNTSELRPNGETAFYIDNNSKLTLMMFNGERTHRKSKVLAPGVLWGSNADSGDGASADTIKLIPDAELFANGSDQYLVIDPTGGEPGHIHLRAGGTQDSSTADLYLGGEQNFVRISDTNDTVVIKTTQVGEGEINRVWTFNNSGYLILPTGGTLGSEGMGWTGLSNGVSGTPVSIVYKTNAGNPQSSITFSGGDDTDGEGSIIIDTYSAVTETYKQWQFDANGTFITPNQASIRAGNSLGIAFDSANTPNYIDIGKLDGWDYVRLQFHEGTVTGNEGDVEFQSSPMGVGPASSIVLSPQGGQNGSYIFGGTGSLTFPDSSVQTTAWAGGRVVAVPTSSTGASGDLAGDLAFSNGYIYYCTENFGAAPTETFTVINVGENSNLIRVDMATNPNYTVPTAGWYVTIGGVLMTLSAFSAPSGSEYHFLFDNAAGGGGLPATVTLTSPTGYTNIWKRVAWSGDTW